MSTSRRAALLLILVAITGCSALDAIGPKPPQQKLGCVFKGDTVSHDFDPFGFEYIVVIDSVCTRRAKP